MPETEETFEKRLIEERCKAAAAFLNRVGAELPEHVVAMDITPHYDDGRALRCEASPARETTPQKPLTFWAWMWKHHRHGLILNTVAAVLAILNLAFCIYWTLKIWRQP